MWNHDHMTIISTLFLQQPPFLNIFQGKEKFYFCRHGIKESLESRRVGKTGNHSAGNHFSLEACILHFEITTSLPLAKWRMHFIGCITWYTHRLWRDATKIKITTGCYLGYINGEKMKWPLSAWLPYINESLTSAYIRTTPTAFVIDTLPGMWRI